MHGASKMVVLIKRIAKDGFTQVIVQEYKPLLTSIG